MIVIRPLMGTVFRLEVPDTTPSRFIEEAFDWWRWVEETFSTFRPDSEVSRIGRGELEPDRACREVRHVLSRCEELEEATERRFSIRPGRPGGPGIDPAGYVKGWGVDEASLLLKGHGLEDFSIDAGGDVLCVGTPPEGGRWRVGVRSPSRPAAAVGAILEITQGAVATSGTYFRGDHIWGVAGTLQSVTVVGPQLGTADALATALFADQAASLEWLRAFPGYGVMVMTADGKLRWTQDLEGVRVRPPAGGESA